MTIEHLIAVVIIGLMVGYITSILFQSDNFNTIVHVITSTLGAVLAGLLIPDTFLIKPLILEYFLRATAGAVVMLLAMALIRKV